ELIGYSAIKAHLLDLGAKHVYSTDTTDVFQEGTLFPGVKLYRQGEVERDLYRTILANSRVPKLVAGDLHAITVGVRTSATAVTRVGERYGRDTFRHSVERIFDHGEAVGRSYLQRIPDGRYAASGQLDNDGLDDEVVPFEVAGEVEGSTGRGDYTNAPDALD